jgi:hypothetical protein
MRSPLTAAIWATGLFTVAGIGFQRISEHVGGTAVRAAFVVLVVAALVGLAAIVAVAVPALLAMLRGRSAAAWRYPLIAAVAIAAWLGVLAGAKTIAQGHSVHSAATVTAALLLVVTGLAVVATVAWGASATLRRVEAPAPRGLRSTGLAVLAAGMAAATAANLVWGIAALDTDVVDRSHGGLLATPFLPAWIVNLVLMIVATAVAVGAWRRQLTAADETQAISR